METQKREAIRYLGYGKHEVDKKTERLIEESFAELEILAEKKAVKRRFELSFSEEGQVNIGPLTIQSEHLCRNLSGCKAVYLFGATLGTEVDRQIRKYEITDLPRAVVFQACASAYLEEYCDEIEENIAQLQRENRGHIRPRFSPGYGDFSICHQGNILRILDAGKNIGLYMTEGYMLTPSKSVTAVIGVSDTKE